MCLLAMVGQAQAQQSFDPTFQRSATNPTYADAGAVVAIDEAHANQHTVGGSGTLQGIDVLVIVNARVRATAAPGSAFTEEE